MIRFINCIRKRPDMTSEQFRQFWGDPKFGAIIQGVVGHTGATGHAKNLTLIVSANELMQERRGGSAQPFDGVLEYWWDNSSQLNTVLHTPQCDLLMKSMLEYQKNSLTLRIPARFLRKPKSKRTQPVNYFCKRLRKTAISFAACLSPFSSATLIPSS